MCALYVSDMCYLYDVCTMCIGEAKQECVMAPVGNHHYGSQHVSNDSRASWGHSAMEDDSAWEDHFRHLYTLLFIVTIILLILIPSCCSLLFGPSSRKITKVE